MVRNRYNYGTIMWIFWRSSRSSGQGVSPSGQQEMVCVKLSKVEPVEKNPHKRVTQPGYDIASSPRYR